MFWYISTTKLDWRAWCCARSLQLWVRMGRINIKDRILYVYMYTGYIMAKLYWRYKKNGKWTWTPAKVVERAPWRNQTTVEDSKEVEQEWHHFGERSGSINAKNVGERIRRYQATVLVHGVITHGEEMETLWMLRQVAWDRSTEETRFTSKAWERWTVSRVH